jgi:SAM-dependent methyltransferase
LILLALAGTIGLSLRETASTRWKGAWAMLAGGVMGTIWMTREESVWAFPMLLLPLAYAGGRSLSTGGSLGRLSWLVAPAALAGLLVGIVSCQNYRVYGFWGIVEFRDEAFIAAYSALSRVEPHDLDRKIPITREARERIYSVSPAFASLRHEMEEGVGAMFMRVTEGATDIEAVREREIGGGWMIFALRDAVGLTAQAPNAGSAREFYRRLAHEVNAACDDGRLPACLPPRNTLRPPWHPSYPSKVARATLSAVNVIIGYRLDPNPVPSVGSQEDLRWVERLTHHPVSPVDPEGAKAMRSPLRIAILQGSITLYRYGMSVFFPAAIAIWLYLVGRAFYRREVRPLVVVSTAIVLGIAANVAVVYLVSGSESRVSRSQYPFGGVFRRPGIVRASDDAESWAVPPEEHFSSVTSGAGQACWICGSTGLMLVRPSAITGAISSADFAITDSHYGVTGALRGCPNCGFLQCDELTDVVRYYEEAEDPAYEAGREQRIQQARRLLNIVKRHVSSGRLVDIGAGSGMLVEAACAIGYQAEGVEPSRWLRQRATERGLIVHSGTYPHEDIRPGFDIATLVDVIEHVRNPVDLLRHVALQLADNGVGLAVTPDVRSVAARVMGPKWWHYRVAHIGYFDRRTLLSALDRAGLAPIEIGRPGWYFSADYLLERVNRYLPRPLRVPAPGLLRPLTVPVNLRDSLYVVFKKKIAS